MSIITETMSYVAVDGDTVPVHMARPSGAGKFPTIMLCYEVWGMLEMEGGGPHMRDLAGRFAALGYVAFVPDYYTARNNQPRVENGVVVGGPSGDEILRDLESGIDWVRTLPCVAPQPIGVVGWCGGGRQALFLAARRSDIAAAASLYGRIVNLPSMKGASPLDLVPQMRCPIFGAYGAADQGIPVETTVPFRAALEKAGLPHEVNVYDGAGHAFMNDQRDGYNEPAAKDAWARLVAFFARHLKKTSARGA